MVDAPAEPPARREAPIAIVVGIALCSLVAVRQADRDALRLGSTPVAAAAALPTSMLIPRRPPPGEPARSAALSTNADPSSGPAPQVPGDRAAPQLAALEQRGAETFSEARPAILHCLRAERETRPGTAGKLPISVDVDANGLVARVQLGESPVRSPSFDECVILSVAQLVFPAELTSRDISITYDLR